MIDDEKIIEMFFERSEQGIRELDIKYGKVCHNLSYHIVGSRQDAEECVNDAYLGAWNAIPPARPNPLLSYIVKIVRNISLKIYWRKEAAKRSSHYTIALEEIEACIADQKTVEDEIEARELARIIEDFLDTLTVENRVIFMRRYWFSDKYFLYSNLENAENETVEFEGQLFNKSDLSEETLKWLEWYNSLPPEKQLTVSSIPAELYIDDGAGTVDADQEK